MARIILSFLWTLIIAGMTACGSEPSDPTRDTVMVPMRDGTGLATDLYFPGSGGPPSTGKVGMVGGSYSGTAQFAAAILKPPHLVTIVPNVAAAMPVRIGMDLPLSECARCPRRWRAERR